MKKVPFFSTLVIILSLYQLHAENRNSFDIFQYRNIGPTRGGRVTAVEGVVKYPGTFYMGATGGGVWKTEDFGVTWNNVSDGYFATPSIGAIAVVQSNPKVFTLEQAQMAFDQMSLQVKEFINRRMTVKHGNMWD